MELVMRILIPAFSFNLPYNMFRRAPMGSIWSPYNGTGNEDPDTSVFIQCANVQEPMYNALWYHGLDGLYSNVCLTARVRSLLELTEDSSEIIVLSTDSALESLEHFLSMEVFDSLVFLKFGLVVCRMFTMLTFQFKTEGWVFMWTSVTANFSFYYF